jgi:predicted protein tyrosine phosphatase
MRNRIANVNNQFQNLGQFTRVLCVCSAGLLRSPTIARILQRDYDNVNVRAAGITKEYALVPVDAVLITWADVIICAEDSHADFIERSFSDILEDTNKGFAYKAKTPLIALNIPDDYSFAEPKLESIIREKLTKILDSSADTRVFELIPIAPEYPDPTDIEEMKYCN